MLAFLIKAKEIVLDILFPPICLNCRKTLTNKKEDCCWKEKIVCNQCLDSVKINTSFFCPICRARLPENKKICHYNARYFLAAAGNYDDPTLQNLIHYFKYKHFQKLASVLANLMISHLNILNSKFYILNSIIIPIPLHPNRKRQRGFNQAQLLAETIACHFKLPLINELKRIKDNKPQAKTKNFEERERNILNCFEIKNPEMIQGKNIILIDDVFTSGATINEAAKILKENGAKKIIALVLAKT